ncbi:hypothetical protein RTBOTA2_000639 [Rhodotorula toruloides]|uniref:Uncharacterized protein n=1 Tax=Rhodotorula toruloides TaxID=5286 RepID=A0A0K3CKF2_RHOTO|nr:hypothetical protein RTBOTA2_000639 [Rhodotorula toruloides]PRQ72778.1 hypothetical protein AAT19DRAFT_16702 [Rhodotorula toruloides]
MHRRPSPLRVDTHLHPALVPDALLSHARRPRSSTLTELDEHSTAPWRAEGNGGLDAVEHDAWSRRQRRASGSGAEAADLLYPLRGARRDGTGSTTSLLTASGSASDSAYGTLDELDSDAPDAEADPLCESPLPAEHDERAAAWRQRVAESFRARSERRVQAALDSRGWKAAEQEQADGAYWRRKTRSLERRLLESVQSSPDVGQDPIFAFDVAYDADSSFDSLDSLFSPPDSLTPSTSASSSRSSPEPSECGESDSAAIRLSLQRKRRRLTKQVDVVDAAATFLSRRHTLPRRSRPREASVKVSFPPSPTKRRSVSSLASTDSKTESSTPHEPAPKPPTLLPPLTRTIVILSATISLASYLSPVPLVTPLSPVHLRHADTPASVLLQSANASLAPLLAQPSLPGVVLAATTLCLAARLERRTASLSGRSKVAVAGVAWAATVGVRVLASWVFGRVLGWAHPQFFSTRAIHEVGAGLAPLLLALNLVSFSSSSFLDAALLAANFVVPVSKGGAGLWLGISAVLVGLVGALVLSLIRYFATPPATSAKSASSSFSGSHLLALALLPTLAFYAVSSSPSPLQTDVAFSQLHPSQPSLLTVLLMTAPRPGTPDFLIQTVESWLGALPDPSSPLMLDNSTSFSPLTMPTSSRLRVIVYTHFASHPMFELAQSTFASNLKAAHYIEWHRDPRAFAAQNRLDQRLHVARGLEYAASKGGAYVLLTEDDFPLCEDARPARGKERSWDNAWKELQAALVATNALMPDPFADAPDSPPGHCGLFLATGGSGLAIRSSIAARLPALLLGSDDPHGYAREEAAARGEIVVKREGEGADTPDLVIQDCLRGKLPECAVCAPGVGGGEGSARLPGGVVGERVGKSGLAGTERLLQRHLGYNASTLPGRKYGREEWACGWRQPFNGEPDILTV